MTPFESRRGAVEHNRSQPMPSQRFPCHINLPVSFTQVALTSNNAAIWKPQAWFIVARTENESTQPIDLPVCCTIIYFNAKPLLQLLDFMNLLRKEKEKD